MSLDDQEKRKDLERQKLLEEIRRRAEEAELKRIEEQEQKAERITKPLLPPEPPKPAPPIPPLPTQPIQPLASQEEQKLNDLRRKFSAAIERSKVDRASEVLEELTPLLKNPEEIEELRERLQEVRKQLQEDARAKKRAADQQAKESAAQERARREANQKKVVELFQKANSAYQGEKYDKGMEILTELLALDPENEEAKHLAASVTKAKELAERIREEEAKRRAEEAAQAPPVVPAPMPASQTTGDVWGSKAVARPESDLGLPPVAEGPMMPPKPPMVERVVERLSKIRIPLKPVLIGVGVLVLAASAYFIIASLKQAVFPPKYSLLVLPAMGMSADSSSQFVADAVTEDLITTVSALSELKVVAPVTSLSLRTYRGDFSRVARNLGARYFLQWSVSRENDLVGFQATLFDTNSSDPLWSKQFQNSVRELQSVTRELGLAITTEMEVTTKEQENEVFTRVSYTVPEAYDAYARGRWYLHQGDSLSISDAIAAFSAAVERDSLFGNAYLGLAWTHLVAVDREVDTLTTHVESAGRYVNHAMALGARSSESYRIRGLIAQYQLQYDRAVEEFERGAVLAPSDAETQRRLATAYAIKGRIEEALKAATRALSDDPRNVDSYSLLGMLHYYRGDDQEALQIYTEGLRWAPDKSRYASGGYADLLEYMHQPEKAAQILVDRAAQSQQYVDYYKLGRIYQTAGRPKPQWESALQRAKALVLASLTANPLDAEAYSYLALTETRLGAFKNAVEASSHALQLAPHNLAVLYNTARMYALQSDKPRALEQLGKAIDLRYRLSSILDMDFYNLRAEPEFQLAVTR